MADVLIPGARLPSEQGQAEDASQVSTVERRRLVPSRREQDLGVNVEEYAFTELEEPPAPGFDLRRVLRTWIHGADPRLIEGSKWPLLVISLSTFIGTIDAGILGPLLPNMQQSFGFDLAFLVVLGNLLGIFATLIGPFGGWLADRVKRVWMLRIGSLFGVAGTIGTGLARSIPALVGIRIVGTGVGSITGPAGYPLLMDYFPLRARARTVAFFGLMAAAGGVIGPLLAGPVTDITGSWQGTYEVIGFISLGLALLTFTLKEPIRGYLDRLDMGATEAMAKKEQDPITFAEGWRAALSIGTVRRLIYAGPFSAVVAGISGVALPLFYADKWGLGISTRGDIAALGAAVGMLGLTVAGPVSDRLLASTKPGTVFVLLGILGVLGALSTIILILSPWIWLVVLASLPLAFLGVLIGPAQFALMSTVIPARMRGMGIQTIAPFSLLGNFIIFIVAGSGILTNITVALWATIPFSVVASIIFATAGGSVERDIRAALASSMADQEAERARKSGRDKMIICRDVDVTYDGVQVLFNVDFDVEEGEIIALLGTNGAGKSTLMRAIAGVQEASNGAIYLDGRDITHAPPHENARRGLVMMPGGNATFPTLTVEENLRAAAWMYREDEDYVKARMEEVLGFFPVLRERLHQPAGNLSGGEQQMVGLGQAFLMKPRLLMIDELSLGLAPKVVEQLLDTLRRIHAQGTTIILVEQSLNVALTIAKRCVFMEKGEIRFSGPTAELMRRPDLIRAVFMGGQASVSRRPGGFHSRQRYGEEPAQLLAVTDVAVSFGGVQALRQVDLEIKENEIVGIIGPNGAGKTTLFDVISGFITPDRGSVFFLGEDVTKVSPDGRARLGLGRSFQNARLFPSLTVRENIAVALEKRAVKSAVLAMLWTPKARQGERRMNARIDDLIELLGLGAYADKFVNELSTGTRRAVDMACIMAMDPKLLLLDEPSSGLAQAETEELGPVLMRAAHDADCSLLVIEHDLPLITSVSDRLVAMELGSTIATGTPAEVVNDQRVLSSYLSASEEVIARSDSAMATIASAVGVHSIPDGAGGDLSTQSPSGRAGGGNAGARAGARRPPATRRRAAVRADNGSLNTEEESRG